MPIWLAFNPICERRFHDPYQALHVYGIRRSERGYATALARKG